MPAVSRPAEADQTPRRTVGDLLRETRQGYGGQIDQIAATLRIRAAYLTAIEESRYDRLPAAVYAMGFVRAYANHLGLDADEAVRRFKQETASFEAPRGLSFPVPLAERSVPGGTMVLAALILALCGYGLWYYVSTGERSRPERVSVVPPELQAAAPAADSTTKAPPVADASAAATTTAPLSPNVAGGSAQAAPVSPPDNAAGAVPPPAVASAPSPAAATAAPPAAAPAAPSVAAAPPPTETVSAPVAALLAPPAAPPTPSLAVTPPPAVPAPRVFGAAAGEPSRILLMARKDAWIQVRDTYNHIIAERTLHAGDSYRVPDRSGLFLRTGNGSGLDIDVDGKRVPALGGTIRRNVVLDPARLTAGTAISED